MTGRTNGFTKKSMHSVGAQNVVVWPGFSVVRINQHWLFDEIAVSKARTKKNARSYTTLKITKCVIHTGKRKKVEVKPSMLRIT